MKSFGALWAWAGFIIAISLSVVAGQAVAGQPDTLVAPPQMRLLSQSQYSHIIAAIFGRDVAAVARVRFAAVNRSEGLVAVGARAAVMTPGSLEPLEVSARKVAATVTDDAHRDFIIPCKPISVRERDDACARKFLGQVGRLLYRRALTRAELDDAVDLAGRSVGQAGDFYFGLTSSLSGMLVAPQFMYIQENSERDPEGPGSWRLDGYSKASRLSFLLWDSGPDDILLTAAEHGDLATSKGLSRQAERMLSSPKFEDSVRAFFTDMLRLEAFDTLAKDPVIYPAFSLKVASDAREQMLRTIVDHLIARKGDYRDLFVTRRTFLSHDLGTVYGIPVDGDSEGWAPFEFPIDDSRAGILTQVGFLAIYSHAGRSSPTKRGRGIRETLLCQRVPDPPPNVNFAIFEDASAKTARDRLTAHRSDPVCAGCHRITDPIGLSLENFDGAGQFRTMENGTPVDAGGDLDGVRFADAASFGGTLRQNAALTSCLVNRLYSYGVGRKIEQTEAAWVETIVKRFAEEEHRVPDLLKTIVTSKEFYAVSRPDVIAVGDSRFGTRPD